jgi:hypothetical protein
MGIINGINHMKGYEKQIDRNSNVEKLTSMLFPQKPDQLIQPDFSVEDAPDVDK